MWIIITQPPFKEFLRESQRKEREQILITRLVALSETSVVWRWMPLEPCWWQFYKVVVWLTGLYILNLKCWSKWGWVYWAGIDISVPWLIYIFSINSRTLTQATSDLINLNLSTIQPRHFHTIIKDPCSNPRLRCRAIELIKMCWPLHCEAVKWNTWGVVQSSSGW